MMKKPAPAEIAKRNNRPALALPTRVITYAWGEKYLEELLSLTIPAVLAPGNLPAVAAEVPCELVLLTEERLFPFVKAHPAIIRAMSICPLRLIGIDDLINAKDKYGMTLTYALHRAFADLGPAMTDSWQIFLNADFILADGSLRNLLRRLRRGERIVASPSYCVTTADVIPKLKERIDAATVTLAIPPREMAALAIKHRHDTIRGKTVNERKFNIKYMDQFYWKVDDDTLLGHQMPIAIVGMRSERHVTEPSSYWDYGLMKDFCPEAKFDIIGDSDEFLMIELREKEVAQDQISAIWPTPDEIAKNMMVFLTEYQKEFARHALTLHAGDLPAGTDTARRHLRDYVDQTLACLPGILPAHIRHPQWEYHRPGFMEARHNYLSKRLGSRTETTPPPEYLSANDKIWWRHDGIQKLQKRQNEQLVEQKEHLLDIVRTNLDSEFRQQRATLDREWRPAANLDRPRGRTGAGLIYSNDLARSPVRKSAGSLRETDALDKYHDKYLALHADFESRRARAERTIEDYFHHRLHDMNNRLRPRLQQSSDEYSKLFENKISSAASGYIKIIRNPAARHSFIRARSPDSALQALYWKIFGQFPAVKPLNPLWAPLRHLHRLIADEVRHDRANCIVIAPHDSHYPLLVRGGRGLCVTLPAEDLRLQNIRITLEKLPPFDLCIWEINDPGFADLLSSIDIIRRRMRPGGKILTVYLNRDRQTFPNFEALLENLADRDGLSIKVVYAGSYISVQTIRLYHMIAHRYRSGEFWGWTKFSLWLGILQPLVWLSNFIDICCLPATRARPTSRCTSVTLEITTGQAN